MTRCASNPSPRPGLRRLLVAAALLLGACRPADVPVRLVFEMRAGQAADATLRFYVSEVALRAADGTAVPVRLDEGPWQGGGTALVALGGGTGNARLDGRAADGRYDAVEFLLGVPFYRNHGNPLAAEPPLDVPSMFWTWRSGYKFLRLDVDDDWSFHLGSTGCVSASAVRPPAEPCRRPNAARVRLARDRPAAGTIVVDVDALLAGVDPADDDNCIGAYADRGACRGLLAALGLDPATGRCLDDCGGQRVFRFARPSPGAGPGSP